MQCKRPKILAKKIITVVTSIRINQVTENRARLTPIIESVVLIEH